MDNGSTMTTLLLLLLLFFTPSLWPLIWPAIIAFYFSFAVASSSPAVEQPASQSHAAESSAND